MIKLEDLSAALATLSGDAVKVAVLLSSLPPQTEELCVDLSWRTRTARELFLHVKIVERSLKELSDAGLCEMQRVTLKSVHRSSMSDTPAMLARESSPSETRSDVETESSSRDRTPQTLDEGHAAKLDSVSESGPSVAARKRGSARAAASAPPVASSEVQSCIGTFDDLFRQVNSGAKPTWGARQYVQMKQLVEKHGTVEVDKRIRIMFTAPPRFPAPPYDLQTLVLHFDKFAQPSGKGGMIDRWASGESYYGGGGS